MQYGVERLEALARQTHFPAILHSARNIKGQKRDNLLFDSVPCTIDKNSLLCYQSKLTTTWWHDYRAETGLVEGRMGK